MGPPLAGGPGSGGGAPAVPDLGQSVVVAASKGTVKVRRPGSKRYLSLTAAAGRAAFPQFRSSRAWRARGNLGGFGDPLGFAAISY